MRHYAKPSSIGASLGYPPDGKRFGRALVEVGLRDSKGRPTADTLARGIAKQGTFRGRWKYDVEAVTVRVMGGYCPPDVADEAEALGVELAAIDAAFTSGTEGQALMALGDRWDGAVRRVTPRHVPRLNGILRREGASFRVGEDGQVSLMGGSYKQLVNRAV